ncbi:MAG: hypothetical protein CO108_10925 [Deltaproteobacteria bacterium CG_4_9_14_3_um_filter_63_12]|nr:MAG: hypothetical protein CO108_10925 [Deltaproteobacteria bacterium CG_4_9_14_3_um_filter_63_12]
MKTKQTVWKLSTLAPLCLLAILASSSVALAEPLLDETQLSTRLTIFHIPPNALVAGAAAPLKVVINGDWTLEEAWVALRPVDETPFRRRNFDQRCKAAGYTLDQSPHPFCQIALRRQEGEVYLAQVEGELLQPPGIEYFIASKNRDGVRTSNFADEAFPYPVVVQGETPETRLNDRLARHHGKRSEFHVDGEVSFFGVSISPSSVVLNEGELKVDSFTDWFWSTSVDYTYRTLGALYAIRFGVNIMRGSIPEVDGYKIDNTSDAPGMNSGFGEVEFELHRLFSAAARLHLGATQDGFAAGVGGEVRIGPHWATHLALGFDWMSTIGARGFLTFAWDTVPRFPMAFTIEATERPTLSYAVSTPDGSSYDVESALSTRLILDVGFEVNEALTLGLRGGYAARTEAVTGGFVSGVDASFAF